MPVSVPLVVAADGQGVAVAGKRPGGDLHGGEVELGVVHVGEAG